MDWKYLLSNHRIGSSSAGRMSIERSHFQRDFDRIVFSGSFRRLQDKTQVFPLRQTDYVRTRLTHSLETSSIGRSIGTAAGDFICRNFDTGNLHADDIGAIVAAAALAHDIGNPPLGHAGEEAIRYWFTDSASGREISRNLNPAEAQDIAAFEGNAQGFRTLCRLEMPDQYGGMRLTCATLGAFAKYPTASLVDKRPEGVAGKKFNFFTAEKELFAELAENCRLIEVGPLAWKRHPLSYLVEAADDIAYLIVDFEDGLRLGMVSYDELESFFLPLIDSPEAAKYVKKLETPVVKAEFLRAQAIGSLVRKVSEAFVRNHDTLLAGDLLMPLTDYIDCKDVLVKLRKRSAEGIYNHRQVAEVTAAGFEMVSGMLDIFVPSVEEIAGEAAGSGKASYRAKRVSAMLPEYALKTADSEWMTSPYLRLLGVLDYISGMSDSYAVSLYQKLKGISL